MATASTVFGDKADAEFNALPAEAAERMRQYFLGVCLDAHLFTTEVCSFPFREALADCATIQAQEQLVLAAFERHVTDADHIMRRVDRIATDIGRTLDENWSQACQRIAEDWGVHLNEEGTSLSSDSLMAALDPLIRSSIRENAETARSGQTGPALTDTALAIGKSAVLLLPVMQAVPKLGFPLFALLAVYGMAWYLIGWLLRPNTEDLQYVVSGRLVQLCDEISHRMQSELRQRIAALHAWQDQALRSVAHEHTDAAVGWIM